MELEQQVATPNKIGKTEVDKICSCYDDECCDVPNPVKCFLGEIECSINGITQIGITDGVCPEMRNRQK